ncbi:MAG: hypothetical protein JWO94_30 [Verrucomicrobiaceae bacterium]|nr:hypothetical protein [Verrucomicrobiaceae bacterium]
MKRAATCLLLSLAFTQCTSRQPRREPADATKPAANTVITKERLDGRERERTAYQDGMSDGAVDADRSAASDYSKHRGHFDKNTEQAYRDGYRDSFAKNRPGTLQAVLTTAQQGTHDAGYAAGLRDRRMSHGSDPDSHFGTYDPKLSSWFLDGYQEGFEGR